MTGPEHYREAERLLELVTVGPRSALEVLAFAQVHAELAKVAALCDPGLGGWREVLG